MFFVLDDEEEFVTIEFAMGLPVVRAVEGSMDIIIYRVYIYILARYTTRCGYFPLAQSLCLTQLIRLFICHLKFSVYMLLQGESGLVHRLVHIEEPILRIPNICIHLAREDVHKAFAPNKETHT